MSKSVVINLGSGNLYEGFPIITVQLWAAGHALPEQFIGCLPPAPNLVELYRNWQTNYQYLCERKLLRSPEEEEDDQLEIDSNGITNVSITDYEQLCQKLLESMNAWLKSEGILDISRLLRSALDQKAEIRVIIETKDEVMRRLPWHRCNFFADYPRAEIALYKPDYQRAPLPQPKDTRNVRILAVLGNTFGIDIEAETKFLKSLEDAEVVFLVKPNRQEFNTHLWDDLGWDILFFAGHSQTEGENGRIYINENPTNNSLKIEQLEEALLAAIDKGLHLAIFNSCDGLGLATALEKLNIPTVIVMREPVPNLVAQEFFQHFMQAFAVERLPLYLSVQLSRRKLQGLEDEFPGASWLPVICQNPAVEPPTWLKLGGIPPSPYRGLFAFTEVDAHLFFGREQFQTELVLAVKKKPLVAVVGASGSGKSSVVFAGLVPQLRQDPNIKWHIVSFRPGFNPIEALARAIAPIPLSQPPAENAFQDALHPNHNTHRIAELELEIALKQDQKVLYRIIEKLVQQNYGTRLVLIVDQFEELYTLCAESERQPFLDALLTACSAPAFTLIITLRADFFGHALSYRSFSDALQGAVLNLGPMSSEELRNAIEKPAAQMQVGLEKELTNTLINAVEEQSGSLPLLEFALTQLWSKQQSGLLTHQAYKEIGTVEEALANHAEAVYAQLDEANRARAQRVLMQLVRLGEETEPTRRLATRDEVKKENWDLVTHLASTRLVVTNCNSRGEETVEIVHEALIRSWGRLEQWIQTDGEFRRWQEQLRTAMRTWEKSNHDEGALLRGKPLADAEYWQTKRQEELSSGERSFILASQAQRDREIKKHLLRRQLTISGLSAGLVLALTLAAVAWWQSHKANIREIQALSTSSEALFASNKRLDALIEAIKAKQKIKTLGGVDTEIQTRVESVLRRAIYGAVEYNRLSGHSDQVYAVAFSPTPLNSGGYGGIIATASGDKTVKLWKSDGTLLTTLNDHSDKVYAVAFSPDSQMIATGSGDNTVKLWKRDGTLLRTLNGHSDSVYGVAFSRDGNIIATGSGDNTVKLWKPDGTLLGTLNGHSEKVSAVAFSPDGNTIASASWDKKVKLWKLDGTLLTTINHNDRVSAVAFSPDGNTIASASLDKKVKLWKPDGTELTTLNGHSGEVYAVAFSPDGQTIASAGWDRAIKLWQRDGSELTTLINSHDATIWGVAFSSDGRMIASASKDQTVKLWKWNHTLLTTLNGHSTRVTTVTFSPDGKTIASASLDKKVKLWKPDGTLLTTINGHSGVWGVAFSPDGQTIASANLDKTVKLWKRDGTLLATLNGHNGYVNAVAFSHDGQMIASASDDHKVKLWNRNGTLLTTLDGHTSEVWGVTFSPDGQIIVSTSRDNTVKLWKRDGTLLRTLNNHNAPVSAVVFTPQGNIFATASEDKTVKLWQRDGTLLRTLNGHSASVWGVAFSPDGKMIASASGDKTVKLWRASDGTLLTTLNGHNDAVWGVAFSPDGKTIASASEDRTVLVWDLDHVISIDQLLSYGCDWVSDYLRTNIQVQKSDRSLCAGIKAQ
ncbi:CHAT domain-containing protein [Iningainema tapete]|uniref:CHAT domain-containing protein n=1 Tax=Iningainema tapete BLCC-T55 TaxID=2748662 RepID=A0A8J6Y292_9CYAN|nr:CHAT domain-containing protein [Iningainema tapete]MBD2778138.1 CHAT domain-containing protein [Iningainema tapete BLCC-T55]